MEYSADLYRRRCTSDTEKRSVHGYYLIAVYWQVQGYGGADRLNSIRIPTP